MNIQLFSSDLDGTLLGDTGSTLRFRIWWEQLGADRKPLLVYNSGRHMDNLIDLMQDRHLPEPDYLIGGVGTEMYDWRRREHIRDLYNDIDPEWNIKAIDRIMTRISGVTRQPPEHCNPYKSSWFLLKNPAELAHIVRKRLEEAGLRTHIVFSHGSDLDVLPHGVNKGWALSWLCKTRTIPLASVVVAGDSGNDTSMFKVSGVRGIAVGNAHEDLLEALNGETVYRAGQPIADGVMEGLRFFRI